MCFFIFYFFLSYKQINKQTKPLLPPSRFPKRKKRIEKRKKKEKKEKKGEERVLNFSKQENHTYPLYQDTQPLFPLPSHLLHLPRSQNQPSQPRL